ncbi:Isoquinoline 1-oxidoreductase alpha subunit [Methylophaga thiooxydans]|uniref:Isoquinoline 1-oxidoreductase alpha subunit n=1 Tax=Methylophaga thiooxydans TaxID=392484 RepID=A0A0A0BFR9_9GAMM|nr:(2Fe-2S)-binding protein [Methylophaga thiooxydans]KGM06751.1 Isoquinoline 1-oxidoreductase alpha subunit [Methylophaga thiooxydans]
MKLTINEQVHELNAPDEMPILWALRDVLGMTGTKFGCGKSLCGACTVMLDGNPIRSCVTPVKAAENKSITTIEAISEQKTGQAIQNAWIENNVPQCGYCQSGQIVSATALLNANPQPNDEDINNAMSGNICRCGTYNRIRDAIKQAANKLETDHEG